MVINRDEIIQQLLLDYNSELNNIKDELDRFENVSFENKRSIEYLQYKSLIKEVGSISSKIKSLKYEYENLINFN